ncbi:hypothetical protein CYY_001527 [Polysphondylium violaceum]|uniref:Apoptosis inducing factor n=1 Tax=Polysphondylium violaceum TaxID=133409 RepID=A0A8J4Q2W8_9MYCE|nr:hypothetical protein CYY_001527 [Polysphondylium violaceum]
MLRNIIKHQSKFIKRTTSINSNTVFGSANRGFSSSNNRQQQQQQANSNNNYKWNGTKIAGITLLATAAGLLGGISLEEEQTKTDIPVEESTTAPTNKKESEMTEEELRRAKDVEYGIESFKYVIIGGGAAAYHAIDKILENDKNNPTILIISKEYNVPYQRPPLSKNLWASGDNVVEDLEYSDWSGKKQNIFFEPESVYGNEVLNFVRTLKVIDLHVDERLVLLEDGKLIRYEKCLIATGGEPRRLNFSAKNDPNVTTYRTVEDFKNLYNFVGEGNKHITVLGGGFLGSELTCAISQNLGEKKNVKITQVFPESGVLSNVFPDYLSEHATEEIKRSGVQVLNKKLVKDVEKAESGKLVVKTDDGNQWETDHVVVAVGIVPNTNVANSTTLEIDPKNGGYVVNAELQARSNVYVAGDVASYYDFSLNTRRRVEHIDHARATGETAGKNMTGKSEPYTYQPFFWSDLTPGVGFEAVGNTDSKLKTFSVWEKPTDEQKPYNKGVIYYLNDNNVVVGVLCYGNYNKMAAARSLILKKKPVKDLNELQHAISLKEEHH